MKFTVIPHGAGAPSTHDTADEAVRAAMGHVYLAPQLHAGKRALLERGQETGWSYGFAGVTIMPKCMNIKHHDGNVTGDDRQRAIAWTWFANSHLHETCDLQTVNPLDAPDLINDGRTVSAMGSQFQTMTPRETP